MMPNIKDYYLSNSGQFILKSNFNKYVHAVVAGFPITMSFFWVDSSISSIPIQNEFDRKEMAYMGWVVNNSKLSDIEATKLVKMVTKAADDFNIDEKLIFSIIKVESSFDRLAMSPVGALGYMQVMIKPHLDKLKRVKADGKEPNLFDPETNIQIGTEVLKNCMKQFGSIENSLKCYNGSVGLKTDYDLKVLTTYRHLKNIFS